MQHWRLVIMLKYNPCFSIHPHFDPCASLLLSFQWKRTIIFCWIFLYSHTIALLQNNNKGKNVKMQDAIDLQKIRKDIHMSGEKTLQCDPMKHPYPLESCANCSGLLYLVVLWASKTFLYLVDQFHINLQNWNISVLSHNISFSLAAMLWWISVLSGVVFLLEMSLSSSNPAWYWNY